MNNKDNLIESNKEQKEAVLSTEGPNLIALVQVQVKQEF